MRHENSSESKLDEVGSNFEVTEETMTYDKEKEQQRQALTERWVREIMQPICCSELIDTLGTLMVESGGLDWLEDALISDRECEECDGEGELESAGVNCDCPECDGEGRVELGEIYKYWLISDRAEHRLREAGETLISRDDIGIGRAIWCRRTTGQGIACDCVVQDCAEAFAVDCPSWRAK